MNAQPPNVVRVHMGRDDEPLLIEGAHFRINDGAQQGCYTDRLQALYAILEPGQTVEIVHR